MTKEEAIQTAGELLEKLGYVDGTYVTAMQERERLVSTYIGMGVAIPHGTTQAKGTVKKTGIVFLQYPEGVDFGAEKAQLVFGIAGIGDEHLEILSNLCTLLEDPERLEKLKTTKDVDWVLEQLASLTPIQSLHNFIPVTIGNIIGGMLLVGIPCYLIYKKEK